VVTYLVNFPDGRRAIRPHLIGFSPPGTVGVHDPWIVTRVDRLDGTVEGQAVNFEVWVKSAPAQVMAPNAAESHPGTSSKANGASALRLAFRLHDVPLTRWDAWWLVGRLRYGGRADETTAAWAIDRALTDRAQSVTLTSAECEAVIAVLDDPPAGLRELRVTLERNRGDRSRG
jgi:hypothetical protein